MSAHPHSRGSRLIILVPYLWLSLFLLVPFVIVFKLSLSQTAMSQPPYTPLFDPAAGFAGLRAFIDALSLENYRTLFSDTLYIASFLKSLQIALISTLLLMAAALPIAYGISRMPRALAAGACRSPSCCRSGPRSSSASMPGSRSCSARACSIIC